MTKKIIIQDVVAKMTPGFPNKPEPVKVVQQPPEVKAPTPKVEAVKPTNLSSAITPSNKIDQNPFFAERATPAQNKDNYLPPEWTEKKSDGGLKKFSKWLLVIFIIGSILSIVIKMVSVFSTVSIKVTPRQKVVEIKKDLTASSAETAGGLYFQVAELPLYEGVKNVSGSSQAELQQKATGVVVLYNNNAKSQFLVKETRLETPEGKIYKTENSLTIPAKGSIEVKAFADKPGQEFNIGLTDFKLPGFKGNPKYETVFGRSKTEFTGGFVGQATTLSDEDFNKAKEELRGEISEYLKNTIEKNTPSGFVSYPGSIEISFATSTSNPKVAEVNKPFAIKESATAKAYLVKEDELTQKLIEAYTGQLTPADAKGFKIANLDKLDFALKKASEDGNTIDFTIKGSANFAWNTDKDGLINELRNTSSANYKSLLSKHTEIENAEIVFSPAWWKFIPNDESRIKYEEI